MYIEVAEYLKKFEELLEKVDVNVINEIEHLLFEIYSNAYMQGMEDARQD